MKVKEVINQRQYKDADSGIVYIGREDRGICYVVEAKVGDQLVGIIKVSGKRRDKYTKLDFAKVLRGMRPGVFDKYHLDEIVFSISSSYRIAVRNDLPNLKKIFAEYENYDMIEYICKNPDDLTAKQMAKKLHVTTKYVYYVRSREKRRGHPVVALHTCKDNEDEDKV